MWDNRVLDRPGPREHGRDVAGSEAEVSASFMRMTNIPYYII